VVKAGSVVRLTAEFTENAEDIFRGLGVWRFS
jgi:hypothetical protein